MHPAAHSRHASQHAPTIGDTVLIICGLEYIKGASPDEQQVIDQAREQDARVFVHVAEMTFMAPHDEL
eukprot:m.21814 g.21814  ORF g.21814 m.21814 type:complete len:68 (-) comp11165_c0_seq1:1083-1286(-)